MGRAGEKEGIVEGFELGPRETAYQHPILRCVVVTGTRTR
jgi:hypothetical protein